MVVTSDGECRTVDPLTAACRRSGPLAGEFDRKRGEGPKAGPVEHIVKPFTRSGVVEAGTRRERGLRHEVAAKRGGAVLGDRQPRDGVLCARTVRREPAQRDSRAAIETDQTGVEHEPFASEISDQRVCLSLRAVVVPGNDG